jgi:hypothetical protein
MVGSFYCASAICASRHALFVHRQSGFDESTGLLASGRLTAIRGEAEKILPAAASRRRFERSSSEPIPNRPE